MRILVTVAGGPPHIVEFEDSDAIHYMVEIGPPPEGGAQPEIMVSASSVPIIEFRAYDEPPDTVS